MGFPADERTIKLPADLTAVLLEVKRCLADGTLRQVTSAKSVFPAPNMFKLPERGPWPDVIVAYFMDRQGNRYLLDCETYHGSGGRWSRLKPGQ